MDAEDLRKNTDIFAEEFKSIVGEAFVADIKDAFEVSDYPVILQLPKAVVCYLTGGGVIKDAPSPSSVITEMILNHFLRDKSLFMLMLAIFLQLKKEGRNGSNT